MIMIHLNYFAHCVLKEKVKINFVTVIKMQHRGTKKVAYAT